MRCVGAGVSPKTRDSGHWLGILVTVWVLLSLMPGVAIAGLVKPDQQKRSYIAESDGYAFLSEDRTLAQTRDLALANAKRQAVEMARTYVSSYTTIENFALKEDKLETKAEGAVTVLEQKDLGIEDNSRYHVWIRAEVALDLPSEMASGAKGAPDALMAPDAPLTVNIWSLKKTYREGERIELLLQGNRDFYARIVDITAGGDIIQLLPNTSRRDNFFKAGTVYTIPNSTDTFELIVSPPFGRDQIVVYASEAPLGEVTTQSIGQGLQRFNGKREALSVQTRGIKIQKRPPAADTTAAAPPQGASFYEASWTLKTIQ